MAGAKDEKAEAAGAERVISFNDLERTALPGETGIALATLQTPMGVQATGAAEYWSKGYKGEGVIVGVLDTGVDKNHPALRGRVQTMFDPYNGGDLHPHGTHVAGTIAGSGTIYGVAPEAQIYDYRVLGPNGGGTWSTIIKGIDQAVEDGCDIINMSLGGRAPYAPLEEAVTRAYKRGVLVVASAGNWGPDTIGYPAAYNAALSVGAVDFIDGHVATAYWSTSNSFVDVCADGWNVLSSVPNRAYEIMSGTSMAAPHVAGVAALLKCRSKKRNLHVNLHSLLQLIAVDVHDLGRDDQTGVGFVTLNRNLLH